MLLWKNPFLMIKKKKKWGVLFYLKILSVSSILCSYSGGVRATKQNKKTWRAKTVNATQIIWSGKRRWDCTESMHRHPPPYILKNNKCRNRPNKRANVRSYNKDKNKTNIQWLRGIRRVYSSTGKEVSWRRGNYTTCGGKKIMGNKEMDAFDSTVSGADKQPDAGFWFGLSP